MSACLYAALKTSGNPPDEMANSPIGDLWPELGITGVLRYDKRVILEDVPGSRMLSTAFPTFPHLPLWREQGIDSESAYALIMHVWAAGASGMVHPCTMTVKLLCCCLCISPSSTSVHFCSSLLTLLRHSKPSGNGTNDIPSRRSSPTWASSTGCRYQQMLPLLVKALQKYKPSALNQPSNKWSRKWSVARTSKPST